MKSLLQKKLVINVISQGKLLDCLLKSKMLYGLRYGFKWQSGSLKKDALFKWKQLNSNG